ncbi:hypothetical protein CEUSTIGMA_g5309.t1 [Chlamydomonas eustigma]|uniref:Uncharacterized protein n=1 Tax=Chlamydomonas eustigma TaxID=1157962 RepID=A0A250X460_9CHLO|nr:hypothetical protein CEUSTIGMA_g5309.t1 [Chlamydomonas eustigma]|eukprot:GAX77867.1 hypothetical protein CEUSTIGMA_g5309.t1 [Chlamydomonas eustigma]
MCCKIDSSVTILLYLFGLLCVTSYPISLSSLLSGEGCILDSNRILAPGRKCNFDGTLHFSGHGISSLQTVEISGNDDQSSTISLVPTETVLLAPSSTLTLRKVCIQRAIFNSTANLLSFRGIDIPNTSHAVVKIQDSTLLLPDCDDWAELHKMICLGKVQGSLQVNETFIKATWASSSNMHWDNVRLPLPPHVSSQE